jgi:hypothetical protein
MCVPKKLFRSITSCAHSASPVLRAATVASSMPEPFQVFFGKGRRAVLGLSFATRSRSDLNSEYRRETVQERPSAVVHRASGQAEGSRETHAEGSRHTRRPRQTQKAAALITRAFKLSQSCHWAATHSIWRPSPPRGFPGSPHGRAAQPKEPARPADRTCLVSFRARRLQLGR